MKKSTAVGDDLSLRFHHSPVEAPLATGNSDKQQMELLFASSFL